MYPNFRRVKANIPFRPREAETVRQVPPQRRPELRTLLLWQIDDAIIVPLELLVGLFDFIVAHPVIAIIATTTPTSTAFASATATSALGSQLVSENRQLHKEAYSFASATHIKITEGSFKETVVLASEGDRAFEHQAFTTAAHKSSSKPCATPDRRKMVSPPAANSQSGSVP